MKKGSGPFFETHTCTAPASRSDRMRDIVLEHVPRGRAIRLLDLGCGTGSLLFRLAESLPAAALTGIDISPANIRAAEAQRSASPFGERVTVEVADYLDYGAAPFDAIVADGVLHLMPGDTRALFRKLARDLRPGGVLICAMPFDCTYNRAFALLRRGLALVRSGPLDAAILQAGRLLHGREMNDEGLRERIQYMYLPPTRMADRALLLEIAPAAGLRPSARYPMESRSLSQLRHNVTVFTRI